MPDSQCSIHFYPLDRKVEVKKGMSLLEAAFEADISMNNLCIGQGICGRCKMIILKGSASFNDIQKLTEEEKKKGYVLSCLTTLKGDLEVEIPPEVLSTIENNPKKNNADLFTDFDNFSVPTESPMVRVMTLELSKPSLTNNTADHQRFCDALGEKLGVSSIHVEFEELVMLPVLLREHNWSLTVSVALKGNSAEIIWIKGGLCAVENFAIAVDIGTTTIIANLIDLQAFQKMGSKACFNSQGIYGGEVTGRIISAEKKGVKALQRLVVKDINKLVQELVEEHHASRDRIHAVYCSGNTTMMHFLLGLPVRNIRRDPYVPVTVKMDPLKASVIGLDIHPNGLLYTLPGISGWVGSDITAGIYAIGMHKKREISLLVDIGTNGEIVIGNREWLIAASASAGPALEGASVECGMRAEAGAIEGVFSQNGNICYKTIGNVAPKGICGSGIIDLVSVLLQNKIIDRSGKFTLPEGENLHRVDGKKCYVIIPENNKHTESSNNPVYISESDIENIITAKAAIFAAMKLLLKALNLKFSDIHHFYIAGAFGNFINVEHAISIGLIPNIPRQKITFVGNTSLKGTQMASVSKDAYEEISGIAESCTYYDLMGASEYVEEFQKAMFLPHTDIETFLTID